MSGAVYLRLGFLVAGMAAFGLGIRTGHESLRWVGLGLIGAAVAVRLVNRALRRHG